MNAKLGERILSDDNIGAARGMGPPSPANAAEGHHKMRRNSFSRALSSIKDKIAGKKRSAEDERERLNAWEARQAFSRSILHTHWG